MSPSRRCNKCREMKPADAYSPNKNWCKTCMAAATRAYYQRNKEECQAKSRVQAKAWYHANKDRANARSKQYRAEVREYVNALRAAPCVDCGKQYPAGAMQFHHLGGKRFEVGNAGTVSRAREELKKCVLLCANCHCLRHVDSKASDAGDLKVAA